MWNNISIDLYLHLTFPSTMDDNIQLQGYIVCKLGEEFDPGEKLINT